MFSGHLHTWQAHVCPSLTHQPPKAAYICPQFKDVAADPEPYAIGMPNRNVAGLLLVETKKNGSLPRVEFVPFEDI